MEIARLFETNIFYCKNRPRENFAQQLLNGEWPCISSIILLIASKEFQEFKWQKKKSS